jgi:uncharacterized membrane protein YdjX (TVP38/TMEM64 family)
MNEWQFKAKVGYIGTAIFGVVAITLLTLWACGIGSFLLYLLCFPMIWGAIRSYFYAKIAQDNLPKQKRNETTK